MPGSISIEFQPTFFGITNLFLSAAIGLCALTAIIRALQRFIHGQFLLRYVASGCLSLLPIAFVLAVIFISQGSPMTFASAIPFTPMEASSTPQTLVVGPVAAFEAMKMLGANGGGFYGMNSAHPFENPTAISNFFNTLGMMLFPFALVLMYGRMLKRRRHSLVIFSVMLLLMISTIAWTIIFDTLNPNPGLTQHAERTYKTLTIPRVIGLPLDQHLGNLEGKEMRFGTSAGATFAALTTDVTCGAINAEFDSLNPIATLSPFVGMWLNCIFGGKGVGMINMLMYIIIGIFIAGMMVGRTPE